MHFIELEHLASGSTSIVEDPVLIAFAGTATFAVLGARALRRQIVKIKRDGAKSVSVEWNLMFLAVFVSLLPYGLERESLALVVQFVLRAPFVAIVVAQLWEYHGRRFTLMQYLIGAFSVVAILGSFIWPAIVPTGLQLLGAIFAAHQPWKIVQTRATQGVELGVLIVYFLSALFWMAYGFMLPDDLIKVWAIAYGIVYLSGIAAYSRYRPRPQ